jgi:hypothetical protein
VNKRGARRAKRVVLTTVRISAILSGSALFPGEVDVTLTGGKIAVKLDCSARMFLRASGYGATTPTDI